MRNLVVLVFILSLVFFSLEEEPSAEESNPLFLSFMLNSGNYDFIERSKSRESLIFKGMLYEYIYGQMESDLRHKARDYYRENKSPQSRLREYLYCFIYCADETKYLRDGLKGYGLVELIEALNSFEFDGFCNTKIYGEACRVLSPIFESYNGNDDVYFYVAKVLYFGSDDGVNSYKKYQLPYYLFMKSSLLGNKDANSYIARMYSRGDWVPKDCHVAKGILSKLPKNQFSISIHKDC